MDRQRIYCYLSSENSKSHFPQNEAGDFKVQLGERLHLKGGWECALVEFQYNLPQIPESDVSEIYICSNLCDSSLIGKAKLPILRRIPNLINGIDTIQSFDHVFYVPVVQQEFSVVDIYIRDKNLKRLSFDTGSISCTLHFKKRSPFYWH